MTVFKEAVDEGTDDEPVTAATAEDEHEPKGSRESEKRPPLLFCDRNGSEKPTVVVEEAE